MLDLLSLRHVAGHLRRADNTSCVILDRRNRKRKSEQPPILTPAKRLEMIDSFTSFQSFKNLRFLIPTIFGNDQGDVPAHSFLAGVTEQPLRALIPTGDDAVQSLADNGVVGGIHNSSEKAACALAFVALCFLKHLTGDFDGVDQ